MHPSVMQFLRETLNEQRVLGRTVLEVGSYNANGSPREVVLPLRPSSYHGIDIQAQPGYVDEVLAAEELVKRFGHNSWDVVICCEMLEHCEQWRQAVDCMKCVVRPGGLLVLTARGPGFPRHEFPQDFWRFTVEDMQRIFADFYALDLRADSEPGVLVAAVKPSVILSVQLSIIDVRKVE